MDTPSKRKTIKQRCGKVYTNRKEGFKVKEQSGDLSIMAKLSLETNIK